MQTEPVQRVAREVRQTRGPLIAAGLVIGLLALNWLAAVARFQINTLFWDQWDFCSPLFQEQGWLELFTRQHGPHRQGLAFVFTSWVMELSGWDSRVESLWIASLLVVAAVLGVVWKWRLTGRFGWFDLWIPLGALAMRQNETVIVAPNASHGVFPLVLIVLAAIVLARPLDRAVSWLALGLIGLVALFTGFGIFLWVGLGWVAGLRILRGALAKDWRAVWRIVPGLLVLVGAAVWFGWGYVFNPASPGATFPHWPVTDYPQFVMLMFASRMEFAVPTATAYWAGAAMLALTTGAVVQASVRVWRDEEVLPGPVGAAALLMTALAFAWFSAAGRVHLGPEAGLAPRYTPLMFAAWLGLGAWVTGFARRWPRLLIVVVGWAMVVQPWADLRERELADWPGTLGMSMESRGAMMGTQGVKTAWLLAWQDTGGNAREATRREPLGMHPDPEAGELMNKMAYLQEHHLSFFREVDTPWAWLPWWNPFGITWVKSAGGEGAHWIGDEAVVLMDGRRGGFLNLRTQWVAPDFGPDHPLEIQVGEHRARLDYEAMSQGISLPAPRHRTVLTLRSPDGTVALNPPGDMRQGSFQVADPVLSASPLYARRGWMMDTPGLWPERTLDVVAGLHNWENQRAWVWTQAELHLQCRVLEPSYLNIEIGSRYPAVDQGPVRLKVDGEVRELAWKPDGLQLSIPVVAGRTVEVELINAAGARSPREAEGASDGRQLALRLTHLSLDAEAAYRVIDR